MFRPGGSAARSHGHRAQEPVGTPPPGGSTVGTTPDGRLLVQAADASGGGAGEPSVVVGVPACFPLMAPLEGAASRTARHRDDEAELQLALRLLPRVFEELQRDIDAGLCTGAQVRRRSLAEPPVAPRVTPPPPPPPPLWPCARARPVQNPTSCVCAAGLVCDCWTAAAQPVGRQRSREGATLTTARLSPGRPRRDVPPQVPMTKHILCNWMSTTKPVAVVAIAQLWERRLLGLSEPVARCAGVWDLRTAPYFGRVDQSSCAGTSPSLGATARRRS